MNNLGKILLVSLLRLFYLFWLDTPAAIFGTKKGIVIVLNIIF